MENQDTSSSSDSIPLATVLSKLDEEYAPQQNNTRTSTLIDEDEQIFDESKDATTSSKPQIPIDSSIDTSNDRHRSQSVSIQSKRSLKHRSASVSHIPKEHPDNNNNASTKKIKKSRAASEQSPLSPVEKAAAKWKRKAKMKRRSSMSILTQPPSSPSIEHELQKNSGSHRRLSLRRSSISNTPSLQHPMSPTSPHSPHSESPLSSPKNSPKRSPQNSPKGSPKGSPRATRWHNGKYKNDAVSKCSCNYR